MYETILILVWYYKATVFPDTLKLSATDTHLPYYEAKIQIYEVCSVIFQCATELHK
jgi:hypothetical protein